MKLEELFENIALGTRFQDEELELIFKVISNNKEMDVADIKTVAQEVSEQDNWHRNVGSAKFALSRMHVLVHGVAPHGVTERTAEQWMSPSNVMDVWARKKGIDVDTNVKRARSELKGRKPKITDKQAVTIMADYAKTNRDKVANVDRKHRGQIIADIQVGLSAEEAFDRAA